MIERVAIAGTELELELVLAALTIRHGRSSVDDAPLGSTATLSLVGVDRAFVAPFKVGAELELDTTGAVPRFRGRVTDAALDPGEGTLSLTAVSTLARLSGRLTGRVDWPAESWSARVARAFADVGAGTLLELELGDDDPTLAARLAEPVRFGEYLATLAQTVPAAIADLPDGGVLVQAVRSRTSAIALELDPDAIAYAPEWAQADDVRNVVHVEWSGGTVAQTDAGSVADFEERAPLEIHTELALEADATRRALRELVRRARPDWVVERAELLALEPAIGVGTPVILRELPAAAPADQVIGIVEGWEDHVDAIAGELEWSMALALSPIRLSGYGATWANTDPAVTWSNVDPTATWAENEVLLFA